MQLYNDVAVYSHGVVHLFDAWHDNDLYLIRLGLCVKKCACALTIAWIREIHKAEINWVCVPITMMQLVRYGALRVCLEKPLLSAATVVGDSADC